MDMRAYKDNDYRIDYYYLGFYYSNNNNLNLSEVICFYQCLKINNFRLIWKYSTVLTVPMTPIQENLWGKRNIKFIFGITEIDYLRA